MQVYKYPAFTHTCMASKLHPWVTLLEGHDKGGPVNHGLQLVPGLTLKDEKNQRVSSPCLKKKSTGGHTHNKSEALTNQKRSFLSWTNTVLS